MLMPSIFGENLFDDWMDFRMPAFPNTSLTTGPYEADRIVGW